MQAFRPPFQLVTKARAFDEGRYRHRDKDKPTSDLGVGCPRTSSAAVVCFDLGRSRSLRCRSCRHPRLGDATRPHGPRLTSASSPLTLAMHKQSVRAMTSR